MISYWTRQNLTKPGQESHPEGTCKASRHSQALWWRVSSPCCCSPGQLWHIHPFAITVQHQQLPQQPWQLHHLLIPQWASFSLLFSIHCGRSEACFSFRGESFVCQLFSITNVFGCVISNSSVSGQATLAHQATCPIKLEHHNQVGKGGSLKKETQAQRLGKWTLDTKLALLVRHNNIVPKHTLWQHSYSHFYFLLLWKILSKVLNVWSSQLKKTCENNRSHGNTGIFKTIIKD